MSPFPRVPARMLLALALALPALSIAWAVAQAPAKSAPAAASREPGPGALVTYHRAALNLGGAERILTAARAQAESMKLKVNIAVVDEGGHLIAFNRMDGARPGSVYTALTKATSSATMRMPTGPVPPGVEKPDPLLNLSLQNAALAGGGKVTTLFGGVPVLIDGQVIGAVGVGGATGEQDAEIARAGIAALEAALRENAPKPE